MARWRLIEDPPMDGERNMDVDRALLGACELGEAPRTVRLYGWKRPTLSVGYAQDAGRELDLEQCRAAGIDWVRRPTGGRALLHRHELTYAVIAPVADPLFAGGLKQTFRAVAGALLRGLEAMQVEGVAVPSSKPHRPAGGRTRSAACFAALNHCEITVDGRKLIGSAQRRTPKAFLQHGSILIQNDWAAFNSLLKFGTDEARQESLKTLETGATSLCEVTRKRLQWECVRAVFARAFQESFPGEWFEETLSPLEEQLCRERAQAIAAAP